MERLPRMINNTFPIGMKEGLPQEGDQRDDRPAIDWGSDEVWRSGARQNGRRHNILKQHQW